MSTTHVALIEEDLKYIAHMSLIAHLYCSVVPATNTNVSGGKMHTIHMMLALQQAARRLTPVHVKLAE